MKIAFGCDHGGFILKKEVLAYLDKNGHEVIDFGTNDEKSVDYPTYALAVAECVKDKKADLGILICGTGIGISIAANKVPGIRCAAVADTFTARATREHNNSNILAMGGRTMGPGLAVDIVDIFVNTPFSGDERHQRRIDMVTDIEKKYCK
ncbi:ribose 5-phosphate isomerase B [Christensenella timonensis]|uniref:ribose 5-phosphate isomerase B n=1 Tax=Christensenella timonensis TaxID=1816678 RepID=UPI0008365205|nr:ribose 5-phosphate isomerase B [Christensenella timonensis]